VAQKGGEIAHNIRLETNTIFNIKNPRQIVKIKRLLKDGLANFERTLS